MYNVYVLYSVKFDKIYKGRKYVWDIVRQTFDSQNG